MRTGLVTGHNVDALDITAGLRELSACGYTDPRTRAVIDYALARWARGEEPEAQRGALDTSFHGINLTSWTRVLAAAMAGAAADLLPASLAGRCTSGEERGAGTLVHAIPRVQARLLGGFLEISGAAVCGARPGRRSVGWSSREGALVTCPKCARRMP